jgi:hypothetical protein
MGFIEQVLRELASPSAVADLIVNVMASVLTVALFLAAGMLYHGCRLTSLYRHVLRVQFRLTDAEARAAMRHQAPGGWRGAFRCGAATPSSAPR